MLALINTPAPGQRKHILQVPAHGQQRQRFKRQRDPQRHVAARAANQLRRTIHHRRNRVVAALQNRPVVHQKHIRNGSQPRARLVVVNRNRLLAQVGGCHHQRIHARIGQQQMLQRRVGQKHAQPRNSRRNRRCNAIPTQRARQHDRPRRRLQQRFLFGAQRAQLPCHIHIARHHCQRFAVAMLALPQPHHGRFVARIHAQVESANSLHRGNLALGQILQRKPHSIVPARGLGRVRRALQPNPRPAHRARVGLRVEAPVQRIVVLALAIGTHGEDRH